MPARNQHRNIHAVWYTCKRCGDKRESDDLNGWLFNHSPESGTLCKACAKKELQAQAAEIERLRGLLSETLDTLSDMTTDEFSNGADGFIRRKIATELGRTEQS